MNETKSHYIFLISVLVIIIAIGSDKVWAASEEVFLRSEKLPDAFVFWTLYYDLTKIDLKVTNVQILPMDDTPGYGMDDADLVKVTIHVTNNGSQQFIVLDKMFELWIMEPNKNSGEFDAIDNYDTTYDDQFEVTYEKMSSRELFEECDQTIETVKPGESTEFTLCYDILKIRNPDGVKLDSSKRYQLVMMDNQQATSCPNCKKITLTNVQSTPQTIPSWISNLLDWQKNHLISEQDVKKALDYFVKKRMSASSANKDSDSLESKNKEIAKYQQTLSQAYSKNLFVSTIEIIETKKTHGFTGIICKKQNNIITLDADYTNGVIKYQTMFFKLKIFDGSGNISTDGLGKIVDVAPKSFRHVSVSVPAVQDSSYCTIEVDSKFP